jgi:hypothetical protein
MTQQIFKIEGGAQRVLGDIKAGNFKVLVKRIDCPKGQYIPYAGFTNFHDDSIENLKYSLIEYLKHTLFFENNVCDRLEFEVKEQ